MLDPFFYLEWLTEKDFVTNIPEISLVKEKKDFLKILVIPFYPNFYESFVNLHLTFESFFKAPKPYLDNQIYHLAIKYDFIEGDYYKLMSIMTNLKTSFFTDDEFLLLRSLLLKNCKNHEYDKIITISNSEINFKNLNFLNYKELQREVLYGN